MKKVWINSAGLEVPEQYVPKMEKRKTKTALALLAQAKKLQKQVSQFKTFSLTSLDSIYNEMLAEAKVSQTQKGNFSISTFDGNVKIEVRIQDTIDFDDRITLAKAKIDQLIEQKKTAGSDMELVTIASSAFQTSGGKLDTKKVFSLFEYKITNPLWVEAMDLIRDSIKRKFSKRHVRFFEKNAEGEFIAVKLDFSSF